MVYLKESFEKLQDMATKKMIRLPRVLVVVLTSMTFIWGGARAGAQEWKQVLAAAKKEGKVVVAGVTGASARSVLKDAFQSRYPEIRVEYTGLPGRSITPRIMMERRVGKKLWDIWFGGGGSSIALKNEGALQNLRPALILPEVKDDKYWYGGHDFSFIDKEKKYLFAFSGYLQPQAFVNRSSLPSSQISSTRQLIDPKFKGKIAINDPRRGGPGVTRVTALRLIYGLEFTKKLLTKQDAVFNRNYRQTAEWVVRGRYPIVVGSSRMHVQEFWAQGLAKDVVTLPSEAEIMGSGTGHVGLIEGTPHPNAAKVYLNWLLSKNAQELYAKATSVNSRRSDLDPIHPPTFPKPELLNQYLRQDEAFVAEQRKTSRLARRWIK